MKRLAVLAITLLASACSAQEPPRRIPLWSGGAPGFESRRDEPEQAKDWWAKNIHNPSVTAYLPPKSKATGAAVVICPGGGHSQLVVGPEGDEPARLLRDHGVAAFVLRYRLGREPGSPYTIEKHAREDALRAMRLVRTKASEFGVDPQRIGLMGFSAGGEVVSMVTYLPNAGNVNADDPIDRISARPDWIVSIYPGPLGIPETLPDNLPPAFFLTAIDDNGPVKTLTRLMEMHKGKGGQVEAHFLGGGGHGFNLGNRSKRLAVKNWPTRLVEWLGDTGILNPIPEPPRSER
jgi:dienelactone hydrolase